MELAHLSTTLGAALKSAKLKLVTAESCTGGGLSYWITSVAGSSDWFERGFATYSNEAKMELLGVQESTLQQFGAVSKETAIEMAEGALKNSHADIAVSITGIAGPDGGSVDKPVGTVWIGIACKNKPTIATIFHFTGNRQTIREMAMMNAMEMVSSLKKPSL